MRNQSDSKTGSALLLTLIIVSLMLVVVLSLVVYVRIELRAVQNRIDFRLAQANAKVAMHIALDQLQVHAGPDQRVTARAEILADTHPDNKFFTGIWDSTDTSLPPTWLVSVPANQQPFLNTEAISLFDNVIVLGQGTLGNFPNTPDHIVRARKVNISTSSTSGHYAWWVADEGVKASLSLNNDLESAQEIGNLHRTEMDRMRFAVPERSEQDFAFTASLNFESPALKSLTKRVIELNQYQFQSPLNDPRGNGGFHHFTHRAMGLLTNTVDGGVKKDLSLDPSPLGSGFEQFMDFPSYLNQPDPSEAIIEEDQDLRRAHFMTPPTTFTPLNGEIIHSVAPVITDFGLQFSPRAASNSGGGRATMMMAIMLELWNPYTTALVAEDLILEISGFEPFDMLIRDPTDAVVWSDTFDPNQIFGNTISLRLTREQLHTTRYLDNNSYDMFLHGPGRLHYWSGPMQSHPEKATFSNRMTNQARIRQNISPVITFPPANSSFDIGYEMPETQLQVRIRRAPENGGEVLVQHTDLIYDAVDNVDHGTLGQWDNRWLTYRFRVIERGTTFLGDRSAWLKHVDKRTPVPSFGDDITLNSHTLHESATTYSPDDTGLKNDLSVNQDSDRYYFDRPISNSYFRKDHRRDIPMYELPRQPILSIGQLQHLYIHGMPPYSIGNPWGGSAWNRLFDEYFLSGIQIGISEPDFSAGPNTEAPHPRLSFAHPADLNISSFDNTTLQDLAENSAVALQVKGQFNINSVSRQAWASILSGTKLAKLTFIRRDSDLFDGVQFYDEVDENLDFPPGFTRFPQSIQESLDVDVSTTRPDLDPALIHMKPGVTFLKERTTVSAEMTSTDYSTDTTLIETMAEEIASAIEERVTTTGHPFMSLNDFLTEPFGTDDSILDHAIEESGLRSVKWTNSSGNDVTDVPEERTPSWLSQADILSALAPFLSTRSDTFTIRAYGDIVNGSGTSSSRIWCEAVVQRVITPFTDGLTAAQMADSPTSPFGRRFNIISFKWLNESDI